MEKPFLELKDGEPFITLEQFLTLPRDSCYRHDLKWEVSLSGQEWIFRYNLAKRMWEKYGNNPPMLKEVGVIVNGHETGFPSIRCEKDLKWLPKRILTPEIGSNKDYYHLLKGVGSNPRIPDSLLDKYFWWRSIYIED